MQNLEFNILQSYDACRKVKKSLLPNDVFEDLKVESNISTKTGFPGRIITSAEVVRKDHFARNSGIEQQDKTELTNNTSDASFKSPSVRPTAMSEKLRTPFRPTVSKSRHKATSLSQSDVGMSKQCASLFSRMKSMYPPKKSHSFDPRYSVRRVIKKSGLLKALGEPELLDDGESDVSEEENTNENLICSSCNSQMNTEFLVPDEQKVPELTAFAPPVATEDFITGLVPTPSLSPFLSMDVPSSIHREHPSPRSSFVDEFERNILQDSEARLNCTPDESFNSYLMSPQAHTTLTNSLASIINEEKISPSSSLSSSTNASSNYQYDTVVMKRTVEMQVVQYLPTENDWEQYHCDH